MRTLCCNRLSLEEFCITNLNSLYFMEFSHSCSPLMIHNVTIDSQTNNSVTFTHNYFNLLHRFWEKKKTFLYIEFYLWFWEELKINRRNEVLIIILKKIYYLEWILDLHKIILKGTNPRIRNSTGLEFFFHLELELYMNHSSLGLSVLISRGNNSSHKVIVRMYTKYLSWFIGRLATCSSFPWNNLG